MREKLLFYTRVNTTKRTRTDWPTKIDRAELFLCTLTLRPMWSLGDLFLSLINQSAWALSRACPFCLFSNPCAGCLLSALCDIRDEAHNIIGCTMTRKSLRLWHTRSIVSLFPPNLHVSSYNTLLPNKKERTIREKGFSAPRPWFYWLTSGQSNNQ